MLTVLGDGQGRYLQIRRPASSSGGGLLGFPGDKREQGETAVEALVREAREELDVHVTAVRELGSFEVAEWGVTVTGWLVDGPTSGLDPSPHEVAALVWLAPDEIAAHPVALRSSVLLAALLED